MTGSAMPIPSSSFVEDLRCESRSPQLVVPPRVVAGSVCVARRRVAVRDGTGRRSAGAARRNEQVRRRIDDRFSEHSRPAIAICFGPTRCKGLAVHADSKRIVTAVRTAFSNLKTAREVLGPVER